MSAGGCHRSRTADEPGRAIAYEPATVEIHPAAAQGTSAMDSRLDGESPDSLLLMDSRLRGNDGKQGGYHQEPFSRNRESMKNNTLREVAGKSRAAERALGSGRGRDVLRPAGQRGRTPAAVLSAGLLGFSIWGAPAAGAQEVRGLVIGINDYVELRNLAGAVNDARDVANALSGAGVGDLVVLENGAATRERIAAEWRSLVARSGPGDTLVLTYAGHGGQEQVRMPGTEEDGLDEVLLLGGFRESGPATRERIIDDELNAWFVEAGERDLRVIFVADSCHSGTLTRSVDPRAPSTASRKARYTVGDDLLELDIAAETAALDHADLPHLSFLAAGQENQEVLEVVLPDEDGSIPSHAARSAITSRAPWRATRTSTGTACCAGTSCGASCARTCG